MARVVRSHRLENRTARERLSARTKPYWMALSEGCHLGYYRGKRGGKWTARWRDPAREDVYLQSTLGQADDIRNADGHVVLDYRQAQEAARAWFAALEKSGGHRVETYTVGDALDDYMKAFTGKSLPKMRSLIETRIRPVFGTTLVQDITSAQIAKFLREQAERPAAYRANKKGVRKLRPVTGDPQRTRRATANRILTPLKAALNFAFVEGKAIDDTAWRRVKPFANVSAPRIRYFTAAEIEALLEAADPHFRTLIQAALFTGARWSELFKSQVRDFDPRAGVILFPETKGGRPRHVHLTDAGASFFVGRCRGRPMSDPIFLNEHGRPFGPSHQIRPMRNTCEKAKVEPAGFHILRHTYGSTLAMAGVPMAVIAEALGHADERITRKHYAHLSPSYVRDSVRQGLGELGAYSAPPAIRVVA